MGDLNIGEITSAIMQQGVTGAIAVYFMWKDYTKSKQDRDDRIKAEEKHEAQHTEYTTTLEKFNTTLNDFKSFMVSMTIGGK